MIRSLPLALLLTCAVVGLRAQQTPTAPKTEFLFRMSADLDEPQAIGDTPVGGRRIFYVKSGSFTGPRLQGTVLPGGGDWTLMRKDGVSQLDVRITLKCDDGSLIFVSYRGLTDIPSDIRARMAKGEDVPADQYYFRIAPLFETASPKFAWLNRLLAVGVGKKTATGVVYDVFALK